jgi:2-polyprenyl-3-methyl-5-hydroxy-6-metoxy-1,4-benzoquinol methylase
MGARVDRDVPSLDRQRAFWNEWNAAARAPDRLNEWTQARGAAILALLDTLPLRRPHLLDLGCGTGWLTEQLAACGPTLGVDLADDVIAIAQARGGDAQYLAGDFFALELPGGFDVVVSQDVIAHVPDQRRYVDLAAEQLGPGGFLIITTTNRRIVERMALPAQPREHLEHWLTMSGLKALLRPRFDVLRARSITPLGTEGFLRFVNAPKVDRLAGALLSARGVRALKERLGLGYSLVVLARKRTP